ncbi:hypothetical protein [Haliangium sp.]|uniref:hypothetical protein n=1 Tax=Haliangium sp. TaxID=2663208 RepID=UPI003D0D0F59
MTKSAHYQSSTAALHWLRAAAGSLLHELGRLGRMKMGAMNLYSRALFPSPSPAQRPSL